MNIDEYIPEIVRDKVSPKARDLLIKVHDFVLHDCLPGDKEYFDYIDQYSGDKRWEQIPPVIARLKAKAKKLGLWNLFLCKNPVDFASVKLDDFVVTPWLSNVEYALICQFLGRSFIAPEVTNTAAPDTGNMELLMKFGTKQQREKYLKPLLEGEIRSAFLMTEKGVSSSDAKSLSVSAAVEGNEMVLNGTKWFASGAGDPRTSVWLTVVVTNPHDSRYRRHSIVVVDAKQAIATGKATVVRPLHVVGYDEAPHGHCEIRFDNCRLPLQLLGGRGDGFKLMQSRLGGGRLHHCMRSVGVGEQAIALACKRASYRKLFGKLMMEHDHFKFSVAKHTLKLQRCRLLVLQAAAVIDSKGGKAAKTDIALAKIDTPTVVFDIINWAIQVYGAEGVSQDTPLARWLAMMRTLRIADGPDEAHLSQFGRDIVKRVSKM